MNMHVMGAGVATAWLRSPSTTTGIHLRDDAGGWRRVSYAQLADRVAALAGTLVERGLAGRRVAVLADDPEAFVIRFMAVLATGGTCVPLMPPMPMQDDESYRRRATDVLQRAAPEGVVTSQQELDHLPPLQLEVVLDGARSAPLDLPGAAELAGAPALIQFSSGSTAAPKGIRIGRLALDRNLRAIAGWLGMGPQDRTASWLPLYHDMGLIGCTLAPIATQTDLLLMTPMQFLRDPLSWIRCFGEQGATLTAAPTFGYGYAAKRARDRDLGECDLRNWRVAIVGAEPVRRRVIEDFCDVFAPYGFSDRAFCPAYGLAEATLVVSGTPPAERAPAARAAPSGAGVHRSATEVEGLLASGLPLEGFSLEARDVNGRAVGELELGELWVGGESLADGYEGDDELTASRFRDGWFRTGDIGYFEQGWPFVLGRMSDSLKVRGELVLAEQAEAAIARELPEMQPAVVVPSRRTGAGITVLVESGRPWDDDRRKAAEGRIAGLFDDCEVELRFVARHTIPRTTSGKPKRRECWETFVHRAAQG